jgi:hypothetical protein
MTELTARELIDTIVRSWLTTRAKFKQPGRDHAEANTEIRDNQADDRRTLATVDPRER